MEWNKGVAVEREEEEEDGGKRWHRGAKKKSGAARNTKEGHTRPSNLRPGRQGQENLPLHFNSLLQEKRVIRPDGDE